MLFFSFVLLLLSAGAINFDEHQRISHDTFYLGKQKHPRERLREVEGYAFTHTHQNAPAAHFLPSTSKAIHFGRANFTVPDRKRSSSSPSTHHLACTSAIASGAVWKTSHGYYINTQNMQYLTSRFIVACIEQALDAWNCALLSQNRLIIGPLLGVRQNLSGRDINVKAPDGENSIGIGGIEGKRGTIAVTVVWGIFSGPESQREIVEFKMVFDGSHYRFGNSSTTRGLIDLASTATHEMGHAFGREDIYDPSCADVTMYGSSNENEIKKRTLEPADVEGIRQLYPKQQ
jgi:hypothetical protein